MTTVAPVPCTAGVSCARTTFGGRSAMIALASPEWGSLSRAEREYCAAAFPRLERFAGCVAAKHAVRSLIADGAAGALPRLDEVEIRRDAAGRPWARWACAGDVASGRRPPALDVSISHRRGDAIAVATAVPSLLVGVDLIEQTAFARSGDAGIRRLAMHLLTAAERENAFVRQCPWRTVRAVVSAKEAVGKILKRFRPSIGWTSVSLEPCARIAVPAEVQMVAQRLATTVGADRVRFARADTIVVGRGARLWTAWVEDAAWMYSVAVWPTPVGIEAAR